MFDEDVGAPKSAIAVGDNLAALSIEELEERAEALKGELDRVEQELQSKRDGRAAAEAVFGKA